MDLLHNFCKGNGLRKCEIMNVIVFLEGVLKPHSIVVECSTLLFLFYWLLGLDG